VRHLIALACLAVAAGAVSAGQQPQSAAQPVFRSGTRLIQVSVIVDDGRSRPVVGLRAEDFQIFEDGKERPVAFFTSRSETIVSSAAEANEIVTNRIASVSNGGVVAIVYDRLNTARIDQSRVRESIVKYLAEVNPDDRIGLYVLDVYGIGVLHDFTQDARSLLRVLRAAKSADGVALSGSEETLPEHVGTGDALDEMLGLFAKGAEENIRSFYERQRALTSIEGLEIVAKHLAGVPGRKSLVWMSSGFPFQFRSGQPTYPPPLMTSSELMTRETALAARALNDADIAVYAIDARGLLGALASPTAKSPSFTTLEQVEKPIDGIRKFAELTGGAAFFNSNDLGTAIRRAVEDSRLTYLLGYYTQNNTWDGKFRKIEVKVRRRGVDVRHRQGYFAIPQVLPGEGTRQDAIMDALESPLEATALPFEVSVQRSGGKTALAIHLDGTTPALEQRDGRWHGSLDVAVAQTLSSGQRTKEADVTVPLALDDAGRAEMLRQGLRLTVTVVPREDAHDVRVVVRDQTTGATGSVIIAAAKLRQD
jgi:VWFA-related protein